MPQITYQQEKGGGGSNCVTISIREGRERRGGGGNCVTISIREGREREGGGGNCVTYAPAVITSDMILLSNWLTKFSFSRFH